jgi:biotin carboxyl carrier protein
MENISTSARFKMIITIEDKTYNIDISENQDKFIALINGNKVNISPGFDKFGQLSEVAINGKKYQVRLIKGKDNYKVNVFKTPLTISIVSAKLESEQTSGIHSIIRSPMSGLVISMNLKPGTEVEIGSQLVVLEAMKMQNEIKSPIQAKVQEIFVKVGQTVEKDDKLLVLEPL